MKRNLMELGRSMIEMLGVLAIVGLLSIIGLYGYQKAMNRNKANELMDMAMKAYHENLARALTQPPATTYEECKMYTNASANKNLTASKTKNFGYTPPSWTSTSFTIAVTNCANESTAGGISQDHHVIIFHFMTEATGGKDVCEALKTMTEDGSEHYRLLPGEAPNGIRVYCSKGSSTTSNQWW